MHRLIRVDWKWALTQFHWLEESLVPQIKIISDMIQMDKNISILYSHRRVQALEGFTEQAGKEEADTAEDEVQLLWQQQRTQHLAPHVQLISTLC